MAERCGVRTAFVKKMLRLHRAGERLEPQHGGGAQAKLSVEAREQLRAAVKTRPDATLGELKEVLSSVCQGEVSAPTVWRELQKLEVPRKKKSFVASERHEQQRQIFRREVAELTVGDFVFVEEMGSNSDWAREYGRAAPGARVVDTKPSARGDNLSVIGALGFDERRAALRVPGAVDGDAGLVFTQDVLAPRLRPGKIVCLDKVPTHQRAAIAEALPAVDAKVKFLPPYSPDFSPIEHCWSQVKTFLRRVAARTQKDLDAALSQALAMITGDDIIGVVCSLRLWGCTQLKTAIRTSRVVAPWVHNCER